MFRAWWESFFCPLAVGRTNVTRFLICDRVDLRQDLCWTWDSISCTDVLVGLHEGYRVGFAKLDGTFELHRKIRFGLVFTVSVLISLFLFPTTISLQDRQDTAGAYSLLRGLYQCK